MEKIRHPFQGVCNIVRFNWHFYVGIAFLCIALYFIKSISPTYLSFSFTILIIFIILVTCITLTVSFYVYDLSRLYKLNWLPNSNNKLEIANINAGFDEISELLKAKYSKSNLKVLDFYNPLKHTEVSIKRARKAYPAFPNTIQTTTYNLPLQTDSLDKAFVFFSAHEIRDENERITFFKELSRIIKVDGEIYVTEHLRDFPNFFAYNIGFLHFLTHQSWCTVFSKSNLIIKKEQKLNPFISNFVLTKHELTP